MNDKTFIICGITLLLSIELYKFIMFLVKRVGSIDKIDLITMGVFFNTALFTVIIIELVLIINYRLVININE